VICDCKNGLCGIRGVENGKLQLFVNGKIIAGHVDPIEKSQLLVIFQQVKYIQFQPPAATDYINISKIMTYLKEEKFKV
jgi:hypothetical protein